MRSITFIISSIVIALAANASDFRINGIKPSVSDGKLCVSARLENVFSPKITGTILSGLPVLIDIEVQLKNLQSNQVKSQRISMQISHDVWKNVFTIQNRDKLWHYASFDSIVAFFADLEIPLFSVDKLDYHARYQVWMRAEVVPISKRQGEKIRDWITHTTEIEENHSSERRNPGFRFSLSRLVGYFIGGKQSTELQSDWSHSDKFVLASLGGGIEKPGESKFFDNL